MTMNTSGRKMSRAITLCLFTAAMFLIGNPFVIWGQEEPPATEILLPPADSDCYSRIVFTYGLNTFNVYVVDGDGSHLTQLTEGGHDILAIEWAPDGTQIVFLKDGLHGRLLYLMSADGSNLHPLTDETLDVLGFAWSPRGDWIGLVASAPPDYARADIYIVRPDGSNLINITNDPQADEMSPGWSPDGSQIIFVAYAGDLDIYTIALQDVFGNSPANPVNLTHDPGKDDQPHWSPDGNQIVFVSNRTGNTDIYVVNADGSDVRQLTHDEAREVEPHWSPNGRYIAYRVGGDIYVMNPDGSDVVNLTGSADLDDAFGHIWAPDSRRLAFIGIKEHLFWHILGVDVSNRTITDLTEDLEGGAVGPLDWSPCLPDDQP